MPVETPTGLKVVLSIAQRAVLIMLAERGASQVMNPSTFSPEAIKGLEDLETKKLITITPIINSDRKEYALTTTGVQIVDQIYASQKQSNLVEDFASNVEKKIQEP